MDYEEKDRENSHLFMNEANQPLFRVDGFDALKHSAALFVAPRATPTRTCFEHFTPVGIPRDRLATGADASCPAPLAPPPRAPGGSGIRLFRWWRSSSAPTQKAPAAPPKA